MNNIDFVEALKGTSLKYKEYGNSTCSGALMGVQSGTIISLDDVSPLTHKMSICARSENVPSSAEIPVYIYGKNLFDINKVNGMYTSFSDLSTLLTKVDNGLRIPYGLYGASTYLTGQEVYLNQGVYQFSSKVINNMSTTQNVRAALYNIQTKQYQNTNFLSVPNNSTVLVQSAIVVESAGYYYFSMQGIGDASNYSQLDLIFTDIMFSTFNDNLYEPFKDVATLSIMPEIKTQIDAISPNIIIIPAEYGVVLDVEYNKDTNKVIEELTQAIISLGGRV